MTVIYTPLIDMTHSDPNTIMSAMIEVQRLTNEYGQTITSDQKLYRVAVNVTWVYPRLFTNFVPRLGDMHFQMSLDRSRGNSNEQHRTDWNQANNLWRCPKDAQRVEISTKHQCVADGGRGTFAFNLDSYWHIWSTRSLLRRQSESEQNSKAMGWQSDQAGSSHDGLRKNRAGSRLASTRVGSSWDAPLCLCVLSLPLPKVGFHNYVVNMCAPIFHFIGICIPSSACVKLIYNTIMI